MGKVFAVSDLHGQYDLWKQIQKFLQSDDVLYMLGDAADRGPDGWKIIKEALKDPRVVYIRGNHDQFLIDSWKDDWRLHNLWYYNGGYDTYEAAAADEWRDEYANLLNHTKHLVKFRNKNKQLIFLSHAGFTPHPNQPDPSEYDLIWSRAHFLRQWPKDEEMKDWYVIHGHTFCASHSAFAFVDTKLNDTYTVGRYCDGHKICIDGRCFLNHRIALLDLDTLQEIVFEDSEQESDFAD